MFALGLVPVVLALAVPGAPAAADVAVVRADADWVLSGQCPDGAITNHPPDGTVQPTSPTSPPSVFCVRPRSRVTSVTRLEPGAG